MGGGPAGAWTNGWRPCRCGHLWAASTQGCDVLRIGSRGVERRIVVCSCVALAALRWARAGTPLGGVTLTEGLRAHHWEE
eukprot:3037819-Pyramimonas_sp.AAC.1